MYFLLPHRRDSFRQSDTWSANNSTLSALDGDLKAAWNFDSGALVTDSVGSNDWTNNGVDGDSGGKYNYCGKWVAGNSDYMSQTMGSDLKPSGEFGISFWINFTSLPPNHTDKMTIFYANPSNLNWLLQIVNSSGDIKLQAEVYETDGGTPGFYDTISVSTSTWYHWVFTADGSNLYFYINNSSIGTPPAWDGTIEDSAGTLYMGQKGDSSRYLDARIDGCYLWHTGLSSSIVEALYNSGTGAFYTG